MPWKYIANAATLDAKIHNIAKATQKKGMEAALASVKIELGLIAEQRCACCEGYGHNIQRCPTKGKLTTLSRGGTHNAPIVGALNQMAEGLEFNFSNYENQRSLLRILPPPGKRQRSNSSTFF